MIEKCNKYLGYCQLIVTDHQLFEIRVNRSGFKKLNNRVEDGVSIKYAIAGHSAQNMKWTRMGFWESLRGGVTHYIIDGVKR